MIQTCVESRQWKLGATDYMMKDNEMEKRLQNIEEKLDQVLRTKSTCGFEYKSKKTLWGYPLVHIVHGIWLDSQTGKFRIAKGIIAIGNISIGLISVGGISIGVFCLGGLTFGLLSLGGLAVGYIAIGGVAIGAKVIGGLVIGKELLTNDPNFRPGKFILW
ncbi:MAG: hypothetical protein AB1765_03190 [Candidatus Hydrogenedentota bacterium]